MIPSILLKKLNHYGIRGIINDWFFSYLLGRSQVTEIDSNLSTINKISYGVPQGSVLGPLLFLIYTIMIFKTLLRNFRFTFLQMTEICCMPTKILNLLKKRSITNWSGSRIGSMQYVIIIYNNIINHKAGKFLDFFTAIKSFC